MSVASSNPETRHPEGQAADSGERSGLASVLKLEERWVELRGCRLHYVEVGQGPPLVHLHGAGGATWDEAKTLLAERFRVIAPELPGFGRSTVTEALDSLPELARLVADFIGRVGPDSAHVLGSSFGGRVATWLALLEPGVIERLVLESPANFRPAGLPGPGDMPPDQWARLLSADPRRNPENGTDPATQEQNRAAIAHLTRHNPPEDELLNRLAEIQTPTLVLFGTEDRAVPPENGRLYRERMPDCSFVLVYGAGHVIRRDRPDAFARLVADFLERGPAFVVNRVPTVTSGVPSPG